jgi:hypothetical protein
MVVLRGGDGSDRDAVRPSWAPTATRTRPPALPGTTELLNRRRRMYAALLAGLMLTVLGDGPADRRHESPVVEEQPLATATFTLIHTNDTRGFLEGCG